MGEVERGAGLDTCFVVLTPLGVSVSPHPIAESVVNSVSGSKTLVVVVVGAEVEGVVVLVVGVVEGGSGEAAKGVIPRSRRPGMKGREERVVSQGGRGFAVVEVVVVVAKIKRIRENRKKTLHCFQALPPNKFLEAFPCIYYFFSVFNFAEQSTRGGFIVLY